jgi:DNA transposition AAA+ family ATPase
MEEQTTMQAIETSIPFYSRLRKWIDENDKSQSFVAKNLGVSTSVLSQYLADKYPGNNVEMDDKVKSFLDLQQKRATRKRIKPPFIKTSVAKRIHETAASVHEDGIMGVIVAKAGFGKTEGLQDYAKKNPDAIYIEIDQGYNSLVFFEEIHKLLFGETGHKDLHEMHVDIIKILKGSGRIIIVDQAEYLPLKALEMLRSIYDKAGIGILLCGLERLLENIRGHRGQFAQLHSRIGIVTKLQPITSEDARLIIQSMLGEKVTAKICDSIYRRSHANTRDMVKMVNAAIRIADINESHINEDVISAAEEMVRV